MVDVGEPLGRHHRGQENILRSGLNDSVISCGGLPLACSQYGASPGLLGQYTLVT